MSEKMEQEKRAGLNFKLVSGLLVILLAVSLGWNIYSISSAKQLTTGIQGPCSYVAYQNGSSFLGMNCRTRFNDYTESTASALFTDLQNALGLTGGSIFVQRGTWTLSEAWPTQDLSRLVLLTGEGPATLIVPGGTGGFDPIDTNKIQARDFSMTDKYGITVDFSVSQNYGQLGRGFPLSTSQCTTSVSATTFLGNYVRCDAFAVGSPALVTGFAVQPKNYTGGNRILYFNATVRVSSAKTFLPLFMEPFKGDPANKIAIEWFSTSQVSVVACVDGTCSRSNLNRVLDTSNHLYSLRYAFGVVKAYYDGTQIGASITTNIFQYTGADPNHPDGAELECCEPDNQQMAVYLLAPGIVPVTGG